MKRILFHSLTIPPDNVSTGMLVAELAAGFNKNNIEVEILASTPQYNFENSQPNNLSIIDKHFSKSEYKGVKIYVVGLQIAGQLVHLGDGGADRRVSLGEGDRRVVAAGKQQPGEQLIDRVLATFPDSRFAAVGVLGSRGANPCGVGLQLREQGQCRERLQCARRPASLVWVLRREDLARGRIREQPGACLDLWQRGSAGTEICHRTPLAELATAQNVRGRRLCGVGKCGVGRWRVLRRR